MSQGPSERHLESSRRAAEAVPAPPFMDDPSPRPSSRPAERLGARCPKATDSDACGGARATIGCMQVRRLCVCGLPRPGCTSSQDSLAVCRVEVQVNQILPALREVKSQGLDVPT